MTGALEKRLRVTRVVGLVAATAISLAAGTNYVYSAYAPQLAKRLGLSATESNLIGTFGNLGMYLSGIPTGIIVDGRGPRLPILAGSILIFAGYFPIYQAYEAGRGSMSVAALCFFSTLSGWGGSCAFAGAMKSAALNFPHHRGTATAFPLAAFGLSAFFFSCLSSWLFPGNTSDFLLVLTIATSAVIFVSFFFVRVVPHVGPYSAVSPTSPHDVYAENNRLHRTKSEDSRHSAGRYDPYTEPGTHTYTSAQATGAEERESAGVGYGTTAAAAQPSSSSSKYDKYEGYDKYDKYEEEGRTSLDETASLFSKSSSESDEEEGRRDTEAAALSGAHGDFGNDAVHAHRVDIRGWKLARSTDFWLLFSMVGCLTGVGLMTINNIGHNAQALWAKRDPNADPAFVQQCQGMHVSIISICSFSGRMLSGVFSDVLWKKFRLQRLWLMVTAATIFSLGQLCALGVENPDWLWLVSSLNGMGYGVMFGVAPTIVSELFGLGGMSQNWGALTLSAVLSGNVMNLFYGRVYDDHSDVTPAGDRECALGLSCYRNAYFVTAGASLIGLAIALLTIQRQRMLTAASALKE